MSKMMMSTGAVLAMLVPAIASAQTAAPAPAASAAPGATTPGAAGQPAKGTPATGAAGVAQGSTVLDTSGGTVGTIESVNGDMVVLATTKSKVQLPKSSFALGPNGPVIAMTAQQLDDAAAKAQPQAAAAATASTPAKAEVVKGAAVVDMQGGSVGTISAVDGQVATLDLTTGSKVRLPVTAFGPGANGTLRVAMTAAQLSAAGAAAPGSTSGG
jgi:preprotein translocase subunit YajC